MRLAVKSTKYDIRKHSFCNRAVNVWNSLPDVVVEASTVNIFKNRLDSYWADQDILYNYRTTLTGTGGCSVFY